MFSATINFNSNETGQRVSRSFSTQNPDQFLSWMNKYLKMPNARQNDITFSNVSNEALTTFRWPKELRKRII